MFVSLTKGQKNFSNFSRKKNRGHVKLCFPIYAIKGIEKYAEEIKTKGNGLSERERERVDEFIVCSMFT